MHIPSDDRVKPNTALLAHDDVTDDDARVFDKARLGNGGYDALKRPDHRPHDRRIGRLPARGSLTPFPGVS